LEYVAKIENICICDNVANGNQKNPDSDKEESRIIIWMDVI